MHPSHKPTTGYKQAKSTMRVLGPILLAIGVILSLIGIVDFFSTFVSIASRNQPPGDTRFPILFILVFPGFLLIGIGGMLTKAGYLKEITQYAAKETSPAVQTTTTAVRTALADNDIPCPQCALPIEPDAQFCSHCGTSVKGAPCAQCQTPLEPNDRFCRSCGQRVEST